MATQGQALRADQIQRIVSLLAETQMTMPDIALRMQCSRSAVTSINRRFKVRDYGGLRSSWQIAKLMIDSAGLVPQQPSAEGTSAKLAPSESSTAA